MNDQTIYKICKALVEITNSECCDYGFTEAVYIANDFVLMNDSIDDAKEIVKSKFSEATCAGDLHDALDEAWDAIRKRLLKKYEINSVDRRRENV